MTVISDWIKTELHGLGNMNIGRSAEMTDSKIGKSKNKNSFKVFCKRWVDELPDITMVFKRLKWIKTFALHQNVGVECKGQVYFRRDLTPLSKSYVLDLKSSNCRSSGDMKYRIKNRSPVCVNNFVSFSFNPSGSPLTGTDCAILENRVTTNKLVHRKLCNIIIFSRSWDV